ncbi:MAG: OprD family outer membrane porin [Sulfuricurvum sp.]|nr:OprD family outer membrane porin [Sulfuricurvum sp.]
MMKKTAILALSTVLASQLMGADDINEMFKEGKAGGYVRIHHIFPEASDTVAEAGSVIGGKLKYQTGALYGLRFGAAFYTTQNTGLANDSYMTKDGYGHFAQGLQGDDMKGYVTLGEAYASYHLSNTDLTYGRQEFKTPMTENAVTIIPNLFEGTVATIKEISDVTITAAHITKMQYGTRAATDNALIGDGVYGITAGAGYGFGNPAVNGTTGVITAGYGKEVFQNMGEATFGRTGAVGTAARMDTAGVTSLGIDYKKGGLAARVWDYYAHEMYNTIYADAEYKMDAGPAKVTLEAQILSQSDVGDFATSGGGSALKTLRTVTMPSAFNSGAGTPLYKTKISADGTIDAMAWGAKAKADIGNFALSAAYNQNNDGHIISAWGGDPLYTTMIFARNEYRADTTAFKVGVEYNFKDLGIPGLTFSASSAQYDTDVQTWTGTGVGTIGPVVNEQTEVQDYMLFYVVPSVKGLWFRLFHEQRDNDTRQYEQSHTRLIANLSF